MIRGDSPAPLDEPLNDQEHVRILSAISGGTLGLTSTVLVPVFFVITIIQFLFLGLIETSRPKYII